MHYRTDLFLFFGSNLNLEDWYLLIAGCSWESRPFPSYYRLRLLVRRLTTVGWQSLHAQVATSFSLLPGSQPHSSWTSFVVLAILDDKERKYDLPIAFLANLYTPHLLSMFLIHSDGLPAKPLSRFFYPMSERASEMGTKLLIHFYRKYPCILWILWSW